MMGLLGFFKGKDPLQHEQQGDAYFSAGDFGQAKLEYESARKKWQKQTQYDASIRTLQNKILKCCEGLAREHTKRGSDLADNGYLEEALEYYTLARDLTQDAALDAELERLQQEIESRSLDVFVDELPDFDAQENEVHERPIPESEDEYVEALFNTMSDDVRDVYLNYGESFQKGYVALNQGSFDDAVEQLSIALKENPEPESFVRMELASAYLNLKHLEEARSLLEEFVPHQPNVVPAYVMLCEIYWETDYYDRADKLLDNISDDQRRLSVFCLLQGETLFRKSNYHEAESLYTGFLADKGWDQDVALALAKIYEKTGDQEKARELYQKVISSVPRRDHVDPMILRKFGDLCMSTGIQNEKVLEIYLYLVERDPKNSVEYYMNVSRIYATLGHEKESKRFQLIAQNYQPGKSPE